VSTSSDPILAVMNDVLDTQNSQPKITVNNVTVYNTDSYAVFTVTLSSVANANISFTPTLTAVTATLNTDYTSSMQYYNGSSWVNITTSVSMAQGTTSLEIRVPILSGGGTSDRTFNLNTGAITGGNILNNDGAYGIGTIIPTPSLTVSGSLTAFTSCSGFNSAEQSFTVSGINLTANLVLTAPTGYEISKTTGSGFASSISYTQSSGTVTSSTVYVRLNNTATNAASGSISATSTGATSQIISTGTAVVSITPTLTLGTISEVPTTATSFDIPYTVTSGSPNQYSITATTNALPSFNNVSNATLTSSPISVTIPATIAGSYNFDLAIRNSSDNCPKTYAFSLTVSDINPGTIGSDQTICEATNAAILTSSAASSGGTGSVTYEWYKSITSSTSGFVAIASSNSLTYAPGTLTQTSYFYRKATDASNNTANSNVIAVTITPASVGGTLAGSTAVCSGTNSTTLTLSGNTGSITKWQSSTAADFTGTVTDIVNTTTSLTASNLTATTYYRAVVQSGSCTAANSGTASITITPASVGGTLTGSTAVCSGTNSTTLTLSGNTGSITKWQSATAADFSGAVDIVNTTISLIASNLTATTYYRAVVQSGSCTVANSGTASITVTNCIEANPDNNSTSISVPVSGNVSTNDIIIAGTTYGTPTPSNTNPTDATITMDAATGTYTFTATKPGKYAYYISVCTAGQTSNCPVTLLQITVLDPTVPNNPPVANSDIATTNLNTAVTTSILANDKSGNIGTTLVPSSVTIVTQPKNGTVVVNADGTLTYTPTTGYTGKDSLMYNVCDNATPANCQSTSVYYKVLVAGAASVTSALDDYAYVTNNKTGTASVSGNVLSNDKNTADSVLTASLVTGPTTAQGTLSFKANGTFTFVPTLGFSGPIDVVYNACTSDIPAICAKATLHIVVTPPPTINPDFNSTNVNTPVPGSINTNDIIPAGTTYATPVPSSKNPVGATITVNAATGSYTFTASKPGKYIFQVPVCAASQTTGCPLSPLQITVLDPNSTTNPPVANNDYSSTKLNTPVTTLIIANDKPGNVNTSLVPTSITINTKPKNGTAAANITTKSSNSTIKTFATVGSITFTPNDGFTGLDSLVYTVCDNANPSNCEVATVYYTISTATPNDVLVANDDYNTSTNRVPALGNLLLNDDYGGTVLTSTLVTGPTDSQGEFILSLDGTYKFTPAFGFIGPVDIIYKACAGAVCINATLHVLVNLLPPPPPTVMNATYVAGSKSNPSDIKSLVTVTPVGTTLKWCDPTGTTCTTIPPTLPTKPGTYIWCVKSIDIVTLLSSTCAMDTVTIIDPYTVMELSKVAKSVKLNPDGTIMVTFVMQAKNKTNALMDNVSIKDDLVSTFNTTSGIVVYSLETFGGLIKNSGYDGISNIDLVSTASKIESKKTDSLILKVLLESPRISGNLLNIATLAGTTEYGKVSVLSNDPIANATDTSKRLPTSFNIPKVEVVVAGGFSPNQDGINDKWIIIRPFGTTIHVKLFNRWGNLVYENENYNNDWDGRGQGNFLGNFVPEGTYFYMVEAIDASGNVQKFAKSLTIAR